MKYFSPVLVILVLFLASCGGGGGGSTTDSGNTGGGDTGSTCRSAALEECGSVTYTTPEGMPIYVDYRVGGQTPIFTLNLSGGNKMEIEINWTGTSVWWQENGGNRNQADTTGVPGSSVAFAGGYGLLYSGRGDCTITTPSGETLRFIYGVSRSTLHYANSAGTTFIGEVNSVAPGNIFLTVNGHSYGPLTYEPGVIDPTPGDAIGYSVEGGHKWGFDIQ